MGLRKRVTLVALARKLAKQTGMPQRDCITILRIFVEDIRDALINGEEVYLPRLCRMRTVYVTQKAYNFKIKDFIYMKDYPRLYHKWAKTLRSDYRKKRIGKYYSENKLELR